MGGFRTPAHTQTIDRRWPPSENLHHLSHIEATVDFSKSDKAIRR
jgi:hypothetical protein